MPHSHRRPCTQGAPTGRLRVTDLRMPPAATPPQAPARKRRPAVARRRGGAPRHSPVMEVLRQGQCCGRAQCDGRHPSKDEADHAGHERRDNCRRDDHQQDGERYREAIVGAERAMRRNAERVPASAVAPAAAPRLPHVPRIPLAVPASATMVAAPMHCRVPTPPSRTSDVAVTMKTMPGANGEGGSTTEDGVLQ